MKKLCSVYIFIYFSFKWFFKTLCFFRRNNTLSKDLSLLWSNFELLHIHGNFSKIVYVIPVLVVCLILMWYKRKKNTMHFNCKIFLIKKRYSYWKLQNLFCLKRYLSKLPPKNSDKLMWGDLFFFLSFVVQIHYTGISNKIILKKLNIIKSV